MGQQTEWYTPAQTCELLRLTKRVLTKLVRKGQLATNGGASSDRRYAKDWVDELAALLANYPPMHRSDEALFELYVLYREYHSLPNATRGRRDRLRAKVKRKCARLQADQKVWTLAQLAEALSMPERRVRTWARTGRLSALIFGMTGYVTARYARYIVMLYTQWKTAHELAEEWDVSYDRLIEGWIERGELAAVRFADGMYRIDPEVFRTFVSAYMGVTLQEAARRIGCNKGTLRNQVSKGTVASVGSHQTRRIPEEEILRWKDWFSNLNAGFEWLQTIIVRPGQVAQLLNAQQTQRALKASPAHLTLMCQENLLPYFPCSFPAKGRIARMFVQRYVTALAAYAGGGTVTRRHAAEYKALCIKRGNIV